MRLCELRIRNYRTLESLDIPLPSAYAAICGANDSGKTNVIRAIRALVRGEGPGPFMFPPDEEELSIKDEFPKWKETEPHNREISFEAAIELDRTRDVGFHQFVTKQPSAPFIGRWRIVEMEQWDQEFIDLEGPGHITFAKGGNGSFHFGAVQCQLDCRLEESSDGQRVHFSFTGHDEMDPTSGRGWVALKDGELRGHLYFHLGDDSSFKAVPSSRSNRTVEADAPRAARRSR